VAAPRFDYADSAGLDIAFAVYGDGPVDVLVITGMIGDIGMSEEVPWYREVVERVPSFARLIMMDKRGEGLSDGQGRLATFEDGIDDVRCVLDAAHSERAVILVSTDACPLGILFAATHPDRVAGLICREGWARPFTGDDEAIEAAGPRTAFMRDLLELVRREWGTGGFLAITVDGAPDEKMLRAAAARWERRAATRRHAEERFWMFGHTDVRAALPLVSCPTLVVHNRGDFGYQPEWGRYVAEHVAQGSFVELPYDRIYSWNGEAEHAALDHVERFVRDELGVAVESAQRLLMTVLFTDIVESTRAAREIGDEAWRRRLNRFESDAGIIVGRRRGSIVKSTGDGIVATFDGPGRAVDASLALRDHARTLGLELRIGLHTGEIERRAHDIHGLSVHLASRVQSAADPGEIVVTRTVVDLTIGSDLHWRSRAVAQDLKGFDRSFELFTLVR
jgi:class 3 adenylate cyclase/pimeloyl-ACP methyl ester carboxylesterase